MENEAGGVARAVPCGVRAPFTPPRAHQRARADPPHAFVSSSKNLLNNWTRVQTVAVQYRQVRPRMQSASARTCSLCSIVRGWLTLYRLFYDEA